MKIVYNAFNGRYADSPAALHRGLLTHDLEAEHVWLADSRFAHQFPPGTTTVAIGSPAAAATLESADVLINNTHVQLDRWAKTPRTRYLQTWHGTPIKRIHRAAASLPPESVMAELDLDISRWDALVSQSPAATQLLREAFAYDGPVLETGYPRNDVLLAPDAGARRDAVRTRLGIAPDATAVLYAPTYRDDTVDDPDAVDGPDLVELARRLGPDVVLLVRAHYYLFRRAARSGPGVVDVSAEPEITDLYLAADVLVSDYSSAVFDFAVTGRPIVLWCYDLAHYRDDLRGFTVDLEAEAPGPVLVDEDDVVDALRDLPRTAAAYVRRLETFRQRWCSLDDGHATDRVIEAWFGVRPDVASQPAGRLR